MNSSSIVSVPEWDRLLSAAQKNLPDEIHRLIETEGCPPSHSNAVGQTALHLAALWGNFNALKVLIELGADCNVGNRMTEATPLHCLVQCLFKGSKQEKLECIRSLLKAGADPSKRDSSGKIPADYVKEEQYSEWLELLLPEKPAIFSVRTTEELRAHLTKDESLVFARYGGKTVLVHICDELINSSTDDSTDSNTADPSEDLLKVLLQHGANPNREPAANAAHDDYSSQDGDNDTLLQKLCLALKDMYARAHAHQLDADDEDGSNEKGRERIISSLQRATILLRQHGGTLADGSTQLLLDASRRNQKRMVDFLITQMNISPNAQGRQSMTALHFAARSGKLEMVQYLLSLKGIRVNIKNDAGKTALDAARTNDKQEIVALLEQHVSMIDA